MAYKRKTAKKVPNMRDISYPRFLVLRLRTQEKVYNRYEDDEDYDEDEYPEGYDKEQKTRASGSSVVGYFDSIDECKVAIGQAVNAKQATDVYRILDTVTTVKAVAQAPILQEV